MSWAGYQNNLIDVNFHLTKSLEKLEKKISLAFEPKSPVNKLPVISSSIKHFS
jgi:sulfopyruvate decarboxylase TPP-binding subunit